MRGVERLPDIRIQVGRRGPQLFGGGKDINELDDQLQLELFLKQLAAAQEAVAPFEPLQLVDIPAKQAGEQLEGRFDHAGWWVEKRRQTAVGAGMGFL